MPACAVSRKNVRIVFVEKLRSVWRLSIFLDVGYDRGVSEPRMPTSRAAPVASIPSTSIFFLSSVEAAFDTAADLA
jgi:hypothetical protein